MLKAFFWVILAALLLRLGVLFIGYHGDLNNNISWGTLAVERGLNGFYESGDLPRVAGGEVGWPYSAPNQPPLTLLLFTATRLVWQGVENTIWWLNNNFPVFPSGTIWFWEQKGMILSVKVPAIIADLVIGYLLFRFFGSRKKALAISALWLFNPIVWYNSSVWGQTDSVVNLLGLVGILALLEKRLVHFTVWFMLSLLFKGSLAIFAPLLFYIALRQRHVLSEWVKAGAAMLVAIVVISIWFHPQLDLLVWLANLYNSKILPGEIGYLTANAFNFWWLVDPGRVLDLTLYFGLPARAWGVIALAAGMSLVILWLKKEITPKRVFFALSIVALVSFLFMTRIHERYLYPFFIPATFLVGFLPGLLWLYMGFATVHLVNLYNLFWVPGFGPLEKLLLVPWFTQSLAVVHLALFVIWLKSFKK